MSESLDDLLRDPDTVRCLRVFTEPDWTLDDALACYGEPESAAGNVSAIAPTPPPDTFSADEQRLYEQFSAVTTEGGAEPAPTGVWVFEDLIEQIDESYAVVSRHGFLTERDFEERLHAWLAGVLG